MSDRFKQIYLLLIGCGMIFCNCQSVSAQNVMVTRQVIGCYGALFTYHNTVFATSSGEAVINTGTGSQYTITQGFEQPASPGELRATLNPKSTTCQGLDDGSISIENLTGCYPPYQILWSTGDTSTSISNLGPGSYSVQITTPFCEIMLDTTVAEGTGPCPPVFYNAFSPNGDGTNDSWIIDNINDPGNLDNQVSIFNRYGQLVWNASGYNNDNVVWKGQSNSGKTLPASTYYYVVKLRGLEFKGYIELTK